MWPKPFSSAAEALGRSGRERYGMPGAHMSIRQVTGGTMRDSPGSSMLASRARNTGLWIARAFIFVAFSVFGLMKLFMPIETLANMWVWPGDLPKWFVRLMGFVDLAGGIGVLIPAALRIRPSLSAAATLCCIILQICAIAFHGYRREFAALPINLILISVLFFIHMTVSKYKVSRVS